jgi:cation:H+ antiporter
MDILYLLLGLGGLLLGAELAVNGSLVLARRWGWPSWVTGVILLALGTSLPELFVSGASAPTHPDLALGAIFGSNAINVGGVLGLMLVLQAKGGIPLRQTSMLALIMLALGSVVSFWAFTSVEIAGWVGPVFLLMYLALIALSLLAGSSGPSQGEAKAGAPSSGWSTLPRAFLVTAAGFALLAFASGWFLEGALGIAQTLGWEAGFAGFLIAAAGTSAPEFFTSYKSMRKGYVGAVFGNVLGSNAFNLLVVGGVVALRANAPLDPAKVTPQVWVNLVACLVLLLPAIFRREGGRRTQTGVIGGMLLIAAYLASAYWIGSMG